MKQILHRHTISFRHAFEGLSWALTTQPNFRIHALLSVLALIFGFIFRITRLEFVVIVFTIVLGFTGELINTSLEAVTDLLTKEWRAEAKIAKDVGAGTMLFIAVGSIAVAAIIFTPYVIRLFV